MSLSFGQALTLSSFSTMVGQDCHLLRQGVRQTLTLPSFSTMVGQDCHLLRQGIQSHSGVAIGAAMSFWQALTLPSFSTMVGQAALLLQRRHGLGMAA